MKPTSYPKALDTPIHIVGMPNDHSANDHGACDFRSASAIQLRKLTARQTQVLDLVLEGRASKYIAFKLGLSQRTVDSHRMQIGKRLGAKSLPEIAHIAFCARCHLSQQTELASPQPACVGVEQPCASHLQASLRALPRSVADEVSAMQTAMHEAQHRMKNMASVILSISNQTKNQSTTKDDFDQRFGDRVAAFCRSLDYMIDNNWRDVDLRELVTLLLEPFGGVGGDQISMRGPDVRLTALAAQNIGLALHELATNAAKYGALSRPEGRVAITWEATSVEREEYFVLRWTETGGPAVKEPTRTGFGSRVINGLTALALQGTTSHTFAPQGVEWALTIPMTELLSVK